MRLLTLIILLPLFSFSQDSLSVKLWIAFEDKASYTLNDFTSTELLSPRAIERESKTKYTFALFGFAYSYGLPFNLTRFGIYNPQ